MKKLVLMLAVAFSMSFVACNKSANTDAAAEAVAPVVEEVEVAVDTVAADTIVADTIVAAEAVVAE